MSLLVSIFEEFCGGKYSKGLAVNTDGAGFTLMELMIAVAIIGILGAFAYPVYSDAMKRAYRSQVVVLLTEQSQSLERFYTKKGLYSGVEGVSAGNDYYQIVLDLEEHAFLLTAVRTQSSPMADDACGDFTLTHTGVMGITGAAPDLTWQQCWGR